MKLIKYFFEAIIIYLFFLIAKLLGLNKSRKFFGFIFSKIGPYFKSKKIILNNLKKVFDNNQIKEEIIINEMWKNYGMTFAEYMHLSFFKDPLNNDLIKVNGRSILDKIVKEKKPVIFVSGHFGNFEMMSLELSKSGVDFGSIYRPLNNFFLNPLMEYLRKKYICKVQIKKGISGIRGVVSCIEKKRSVALMLDQRVSEGEKINFFKNMAHTTTLPAQLCLKYKIDIVPIFLKRNKLNNFEIEIMKPIDYSFKENNNKNKIEISIELNKIIEKMVLRNPEQWIWTHNRWK